MVFLLQISLGEYLSWMLSFIICCLGSYFSTFQKHARIFKCFCSFVCLSFQKRIFFQNNHCMILQWLSISVSQSSVPGCIPADQCLGRVRGSAYLFWGWGRESLGCGVTLRRMFGSLGCFARGEGLSHLLLPMKQWARALLLAHEACSDCLGRLLLSLCLLHWDNKTGLPLLLKKPRPSSFLISFSAFGLP